MLDSGSPSIGNAVQGCQQMPLQVEIYWWLSINSQLAGVSQESRSLPLLSGLTWRHEE